MAITVAIILAGWFIAIIILLKMSRGPHAGDEAQAVGCLLFVEAAILLAGLVLALAVIFHQRWLVYVMLVATGFPTLIALPQIVYAWWKSRKKQWRHDQTRIPPDQLATRLAGKTHVSKLRTEQPAREWKEFYYYAPDGHLRIYEEEGGVLKLPPREATWEIQKGRLAILDRALSPRMRYYILKDAPQGQIAYYIHAPWQKVNGLLTRIVAEIRDGEPVADHSASPAS